MDDLHDIDAAVRSSQTQILTVSAQQTLGSVISVIHASEPRWVVVVHEEDSRPTPYLYAFRPEELESRFDPSTAHQSLREALNLQESDESAVETEGGARVTGRSDGAAAAVRVITVNTDHAPTAVAEPVVSITRGQKGAKGAKGGGGPPQPAADTLDVRLAVHAPSVLSLGSVDVIDIIIGTASDAFTLPDGLAATASPVEPIAAVLTIFGDAIVATGPNVLKLDPPKAGAPSQSSFEIRAVREGTAQAAVIFHQGGSELGNIRHAICVGTGNGFAKRAAGSVSAAPRVPGDDGVLLLQVERTGVARKIRYQYRVHCPRLGLDFAQFESPPLLDDNGSPAASELQFVHRIYASMTNQVLRSPGEIKRFALEIEAFAEDLCTQLFPPDLVRVLWDGRDQIASIRIMSWEPYIPWELVRLAIPGGPKSDDRFLGQYGLVRWLAGRSATRTLPLTNWSYLAATYPNNPANNVTREVEYFTASLPQHGIHPVQVASTYDAFLEALQNPTFDVLHVACHGNVKQEKIEKAELFITDELINGRARYVGVTANVFAKVARFGDRRPLVFLNACEAGRLGGSLTTWGGWPTRLINAGAGAVVGASWPVRDVASNKFATAFYDSLLGGRSLSTAATDARQAAAAVGDATWLAFKVFGDPHAQR